MFPADGTYEVFVKYPSGVSGAATDAKYTIKDGSLVPPTKTVDQTSGGGSWRSLGSYSLKEGNHATIELSDLATGTLAGSIETAVARGLSPGRNFVTIGPWELGIDTRGNVIYHALYRP